MLAALLLVATVASAVPPDQMHITGAEKAACTQDALRLCSGTYPDEEKSAA